MHIDSHSLLHNLNLMVFGRKNIILVLACLFDCWIFEEVCSCEQALELGFLIIFKCKRSNEDVILGVLVVEGENLCHANLV